MRRFALIGAGWLAIAWLASAASAADLPGTYTKASNFTPAAYDWSGFYLGLNGGGASSRGCWTITNSNGAAVTPNTEGCQTATGGIAGGQAGYRWQASPSWVVGAEFMGDWTNLTGSNPSLTAIIPYTNQAKVEGFGMLTGQVGYAWNSALLYLKGGVAIIDTKYSSFFTPNGGQFNYADNSRWGGVVGAGVEYTFAPNWSVGAEYDHLFMGSASVTFPPTNNAVSRIDTISQGVDMGTVRVNYRFGGPIISKY